MSKMLLSINPEHVDNILQGKKHYEYRKRRCKEGVNSILIYATSPQKKVVAEVEIRKVLEGSVQEIWNKTKDGAGITKRFFNLYYNGKETAVAYELGHITQFKKPHELNEYGVLHAPQSFVYVD